MWSHRSRFNSLGIRARKDTQPHQTQQTFVYRYWVHPRTLLIFPRVPFCGNSATFSNITSVVSKVERPKTLKNRAVSLYQLKNRVRAEEMYDFLSTFGREYYLEKPVTDVMKSSEGEF